MSSERAPTGRATVAPLVHSTDQILPEIELKIELFTVSDLLPSELDKQ